jgi:hypothetical protein
MVGYFHRCAAESPASHREIAAMVVKLDRAVLDCDSGNIGEKRTANPELKTLPAWRDLAICVREALEQAASLWLRGAFGVETIIQVDAD